MTPRLPQPGGTHEAGSEPDSPRWNPGSAADHLGHLGQLKSRLCATGSSSSNWDDKTTSCLAFAGIQTVLHRQHENSAWPTASARQVLSYPVSPLPSLCLEEPLTDGRRKRLERARAL